MLQPAIEQPDEGVTCDLHRLCTLGERAAFDVSQLEGLTLVRREPVQDFVQANGVFAAGQSLAGRYCVCIGDVQTIERSVAPGGALAGMQMLPDRVLNIVFVNLPDPGDELGGVAAIKIANLLVHRQTRLLHQIRRIDAAADPGIQQSVRNLAQVGPVMFKQLTQRSGIALLRPLEQFSPVLIAARHDRQPG